MTDARSARPGLLALLSLIVVTAVPAGAQSPDPNQGLTEGLRESLRRRHGQHPISDETTLRSVLRKGKAAIPCLVRILREPGREPTADGGHRPVALSDDDRQFVHRCLGSFASEDMNAYLEGAAFGPGATMRDGLTVAGLVGAIGSSDNLAIVLRIMGAIDERSLASPVHGATYRHAIRDVLSREVKGFEVVVQECLRLDGRVFATTVDAIASVGSAEALRCLGALLGASPEKDLIVLQRIGQARGGANPEVLGEIRPHIRRCMSWGSVRLRKLAARALGELDDVGAVDDLVSLLETDESMASVASWSLNRITGQRRQQDADAWKSWLEAENTWFADSWPNLRERLGSDRPEVAAAAVRSSMAHRLFRDQIGAVLAEALSESAPGLRRMMCAILARVGARGQLETLVRSLDDTEPAVRSEAHRALEQLTTRALPGEAAAWRAWLADRR